MLWCVAVGCAQVKAWCYYESRLLGAHHGLISTYALETLVLYVFNKYHETIDSPLSVGSREGGSCADSQSDHAQTAQHQRSAFVLCKGTFAVLRHHM